MTCPSDKKALKALKRSDNMLVPWYLMASYAYYVLDTPLISDLIFKGDVHEIKEIMKKSRNLGMQTFDQSLFDLYEANQITYEDALRNADSVNDLRLQIKLNSQRAKRTDLAEGTEHLTIM